MVEVATKLCLALYKLTEGFPHNEPLKRNLRQKAVGILEKSVIMFDQYGICPKEKKSFFASKALLEIQSIGALLNVAKNQPTANKDYFLVLAKEFAKLTEPFWQAAQKSIKKKEASIRLSSNPSKSNDYSVLEGKERCLKIIETLKKKKALQVRDLEEIFPETSKRTIRRDFEFLLSQGIVKRKGDWNSTEYELK